MDIKGGQYDEKCCHRIGFLLFPIQTLVFVDNKRCECLETHWTMYITNKNSDLTNIYVDDDEMKIITKEDLARLLNNGWKLSQM